MAYLFGAGVTDKIDVGTGVTLWTTAVSVFARFTVTNALDACARGAEAWPHPFPAAPR
jgi:hypothetical protein